MEIERKWLLNEIPSCLLDLKVLNKSTIYQGYISTNPTVRIRKKVCNGFSTYRMCIKSEGTLCREEIEMDITKEKYEELKLFINKPFIEKDFCAYYLPTGEILEVSVVDRNKPESYIYAEIEFPTVEDAQAFTPPSYLKNEKTNDTSFGMKQYWERTRKQNENV